MRTPKDLAANRLVGQDEHVRRSTTLRRLAGGIRTQVQSDLDLDARERKTLVDAAALLERMADASKSAAALVQKRRAEEGKREAEIRQHMKSNFGALCTPGDQVALIAAVKSYALKGDAQRFKDPSALRDEFDDALESLSYTLMRSQENVAAMQVVEQAWQKFVEAKAGLLAKHQVLIDALAVPR